MRSGEALDTDTTGQKLCEVCGETFDLDDFDQIFYHDAEPHEPRASSDGA